MDVKSMTSFILWFCFIASLSISLTTSASVDTRQRFRRQNDESIACPEGTKPCKDDHTMCAVYCNGNLECADGSDEMDCITTASITNASASDANSTSEFLTIDVTNTPLSMIVNASATSELEMTKSATMDVETTEKIVMSESTTESNGVEMERVNVPGETTTEAGDDAVTTASGAETTGSDLGTASAVPTLGITEEGAAPTEAETATAGPALVTTEEGATSIEAETAPAEPIVGTTEEGAAPTEAETASAEPTVGTTEEGAVSTETVEAVTAEDDTAGNVTAVVDASETSTIVLVDNGTDIFTSILPGNDDATTVELVTIDSNATEIAANEGTTIVLSDVTNISLNDTDSGNDTLWTTTIDAIDDGNGTQANNITENVVTPAHAVPAEPTPDRVELRVVVSPEILQVQYGQTYELTCGVYGADAATSIYWIQEEPERRYALTEPVDANDKQITMSQVSLRTRIRIDDRSKIGKYTCMAQDGAGNSGSAILTMQEGSGHYVDYPPPAPSGPSGSGYLRIIAPDMSDGDYVEIQCEGASPEDEGRIQWFFNNRALNDEQPLYPRGKTLHIRPISRPYLGNYRCSIPGSSYADANSVLTFGPAIPDGGAYYGTFSVSIAIVQGQTGQGQAQEGSQVVLVAQPTEQATSFRWTFSSNQGTVDRGYTNQLVIPRATGSDSGVYTVEATNNRGQTARGSINLYVSSSAGVGPTGRCSIDEATCRNGRCIPRSLLFDGKDDCGDNSDEGGHGAGADSCQPNEIHCANPDRGRKCVQKFWMCDGDRDCDDGSDESQAYCELLPRQLNCKPSEFQCGGPNATTSNPVCIPRSFQCDGYTDCPDRSDEVGCTKPTVVTAPQRQIQINVGQTLTIQCVARGSPAPYVNWRLNWGFVCNDGSDNGRCTMSQSINPADPSLVTGTLTVRNVNVGDGGAYSCEALNNQGFIFAVPDALVDVMSGGAQPSPSCNCNGHSTYCSPTGQCHACQHNTVGYNCESCAPGYEGDARRGTPYDCQPVAPSRPQGYSNCNPQGTFTERDGRCICKYNVEGDRCDQCKRSHYYLNPTTPNGCLSCFCSGVSTDCRSTDWRRQALALPLYNWNAVPKNFANDQYEAGNRIQQRDGGRELHLDQSSLGRPAKEVLYWKAPKSALGDVVTLYDGNIDVYFTNDGNDNQAPSDDEFIWLRGNNIDLVHKLPQSQRFKANTNATYSVAVNERTFTRKDGTYIDRENILMALSDLDTLLVKINPIGGYRTAVLRGVALNVASPQGYADAAPTVESCSCPANYTGSSCERCAEGYGRPHPLVGIYLGQCWSCQSLCNQRSDRCDRDTGKCSDCQGNSEGDRCERCRSGYVLDARINQCVSQDQYQPITGSGIYVDQRPYDSRGITPLTIVLDPNQVEQRVPVQVLNSQPLSVVWGRTDGSPLPVNVYQSGNDLVFRNPSAEQTGNYICTIANPGGSVDHINIYVEYRPAQQTGYGFAVFNPPSPLILSEGADRLIQPQGGYYRVQWRRENGQPLPSGIYQKGNALQITNARHDHSGTYICELYGASGAPQIVSYEIRVNPGPTHQPSSGGPPRISIEPKTINLKEGQRMIVQYTVSSQDPIDVKWNKRTNQGYEPIPSLFTVEPNRLVLSRATLDASGIYQVVVSNTHGVDRQELRINVEPRRSRGRGQQAHNNAPQIRFQQSQYEVGYGEVIDVQPNIYGSTGATITWTKDGSTSLPEGVSAREDGSLRIEGRSNQIDGQYTLDVVSAYGRASTPIFIRWKQGHEHGYDHNQDGSRGYYAGQAGDDGHGSHGGHGGYQYGYDQQAQQNAYVEVTVEPTEASLQGGETANLTCQVKGTQQYTVTWGKYAHDTALPSYARQEGNSVILAPSADAPADQMYLQCSVNVPGLAQPYHGYAAVTIRGAHETLKKKKKRRSTAH